MADLTKRSIIGHAVVLRFLNRPAGDTALVEKLMEWIDLASGEIERRTNRKIAAQAVEVIMDGSGTSELLVPWVPVLEVKGTEDADTAADGIKTRDADGTGTWAALTADDSLITIPQSRHCILLLGGEIFPCGTENVKVNYIAGYAAADIPADLKRVCLEMVLKLYHDSPDGRSSFGKGSNSQSAAGGSGSEGFLDFEPKWENVLTRYRSRRMT